MFVAMAGAACSMVTEAVFGRKRWSYTWGEEKAQPPGQPCKCVPLGSTLLGNAQLEQQNLNVQAWRLEQQLAPIASVGLVPFFNLTAPRHDMHRGHYCAFSGQKTPGRCCDCTHFCYTPLFWDAVFGGLYRTVRRSVTAHQRSPRAIGGER